MRALLTGPAGLVGRVALELLSGRHEVTAFDMRPVEGCGDAVQGDVLDYAAVLAAMEGRDSAADRRYHMDQSRRWFPVGSGVRTWSRLTRSTHGATRHLCRAGVAWRC